MLSFEKARPDLYAYQEIGLMVPDVTSFRPEADVAVLDSSAMARTRLYADRFYLVAEVLSDSNTDKDIAAKSVRYLQHPQNLHFVLIEQRRVRVEVWARAAGWEPVVLDRLDAVLELPEWGFHLPLAALYRGTSLDVSAQSSDPGLPRPVRGPTHSRLCQPHRQLPVGFE